MQTTFMLAVAGCMSTSLLQEPKPLAPGKVRGALGIESGGHRTVFDTTPVVGVRVGVASRTEVRGKLSLGGGELGLNVQVIDSAFVDLMLMPAFFDYDIDDIMDEYQDRTHLVGFELPIILSVSLDERDQFQLFAGPDLRAGARNGSGWGGVGFHLGAAISGPRDHGTFVPECAFLQSLSGSYSDDDGAPARVLTKHRNTLTCSFGVTLGATHAPRAH